jgi:Flp pilus assembly protein TadG
MVRIGTRPARRSGTTIAEAATVIALTLLFLFGIYEYGRFVMIKNLLDNAAREGSRYAVVHTYDKTTTDIQNRVLNYLAGQSAQLQNLNIQVYQSDSNGNNIGPWTDTQFGQYIAVQIDGDFHPMLPSILFMPTTMHLETRSVMYSEAN